MKPSSIWVRGLGFIFGPILFSGWAVFLLFMLMMAAGGNYPGSQPCGFIYLDFVWLAGAVFILGAVLSLWRLVIVGSGRVNRHPFSRWFSIVTASLVLASNAVCLLICLLGLTQALMMEEGIPVLSIVQVLWGLGILVGFVGSMWVWLRYLPLLLRGNRS